MESEKTRKSPEERRVKPKRRALTWVAMLGFGLLLGVCCGLLIVAVLPERAYEGSLWRTYGICALLFLWLYASYRMQIIAHEAGHLLFGLLTGYRFASLRIGSLMWIERGGQIARCRYKLAGTAGQCLMKPPEGSYATLPVMLYNLGGVILNAATGLILLVAGPLARGYIRGILLLPAVVGFALALMNGIPLRGAVANDGANALALRRDEAARRAFWIQLKQVELLGEGVRLRDMPEAEEWFAMPDDGALGNGLIAEQAAFRCNYLMDAHRFAEAAETIDHLLDVPSALAEINRRLLICDRATCAVLLDEGAEKVAALLDEKAQRNAMRAMRDQPSVLRTRCLRALLDGDEGQARKLQARFEVISKRYPYPSEIAGERELMELLNGHSASN